MPIVAANGIDIAYDEVGDKSKPALARHRWLTNQSLL